MAGLDDHHGVIHWNSCSTAAESLVTGGLISSWSEGTIGHGLLTSGSSSTSSWCSINLSLYKVLDGPKISSTFSNVSHESIHVGIEHFFLACNNGSKSICNLAINYKLLGINQCGLVAQGCNSITEGGSSFSKGGSQITEG